MGPVENLADLANWKDYRPDLQEHKKIPLKDLSTANVYSLFESVEHFEGNGNILGRCIVPDAPNPGIVFNKKVVPLPLGEDQDVCVFGFTGNSRFQPRKPISQEMLQCTNPSWPAALSNGVRQAVDLMNMKGAVRYRTSFCFLGFIEASPGQSQKLDLQKSGDGHFVTILVFLPSIRQTATVDVRHGPLTATHDLAASTPFTTHFVSMYTGIEHAIIKNPSNRLYYLQYHLYDTSATPDRVRSLSNLMGPSQEISLAFAAWRLALSSGTKADDIPSGYIFYHLDGLTAGEPHVRNVTDPRDKFVLARLAPAAKHYGFNIFLAYAELFYEHKWEVVREYKEYDNEYDEDDYEMDEDIEPDEVTWTLTQLNGKVLKNKKLERELHREVIEREGGRWVYNFHLGGQPYEDRYFEVEDQTCYEDHLRISATKNLWFLVIGPDPEYIEPPHDEANEDEEGDSDESMEFDKDDSEEDASEDEESD